MVAVAPTTHKHQLHGDVQIPKGVAMFVEFVLLSILVVLLLRLWNGRKD